MFPPGSVRGRYTAIFARQRARARIGGAALGVVSAFGVAACGGDVRAGGRPGGVNPDASTLHPGDASHGLQDVGTPLGPAFVPGSPQGCTTLVPWAPHPRALVVKNGDGFASVVITDAASMLTVFDVKGDRLRDVGTLRAPAACSGGPYGVWQGGGQTVALSAYQYKAYCGTDLTIAGATTGIVSGGTDPLHVSHVAISVRDDGRSVLAQSAVAQFTQVTPQTPRTITLSLLDQAGIEISKVTLPPEPMDVGGVAVSHTGYVALVLYSGGAATTPDAVQVILLDPAFQVMRTWSAPAGVAINAVAFAADDSVVVAGSGPGAVVGLPVMWLEHLSFPELSPLSPAATGASGSIEDISIAQGKVLLAGADAAKTRIQLDTWSLDGTPAVGPRFNQSLNGLDDLRLQVQSDGSLLVQSGGAGYTCQ